jgi:hypothetical protein
MTCGAGKYAGKAVYHIHYVTMFVCHYLKIKVQCGCSNLKYGQSGRCETSEAFTFNSSTAFTAASSVTELGEQNRTKMQ